MALTQYNNAKHKWELIPGSFKKGDYFILVEKLKKGCKKKKITVATPVKGYLCEVDNRRLIIHKSHTWPDEWVVSDFDTGLKLVTGGTRIEACRTFDTVNEEKQIIKTLNSQEVRSSDYFLNLKQIIAEAYSVQYERGKQ